MLVLSRRQDESVVLGDEVTVTVEEISDDDGQRIYGAKVRLGFESPRHVSIYRSEWREREEEGCHDGGGARRRRPLPGKLVEISDAHVLLKIQVPRKIPVCCNGKPTIGSEPETQLDDGSKATTVVHRILCHKEDRITICNNIVVATLDFQRFIPLVSCAPT